MKKASPSQESIRASTEVQLRNYFNEWKKREPKRREPSLRVDAACRSIFEMLNINPIKYDCSLFAVRRRWSINQSEYVDVSTYEYVYDPFFESTTWKNGRLVASGFDEWVLPEPARPWWQRLFGVKKRQLCNLCRHKSTSNAFLAQAIDVIKSHSRLRKMIESYGNWGDELDQEMRHEFRQIHANCCRRFSIPFVKCFVCEVGTWSDTDTSDSDFDADMYGTMEDAFRAIKSGKSRFFTGRCKECGTEVGKVYRKRTSITQTCDAEFEISMSTLMIQSTSEFEKEMAPFFAYNQFVKSLSIGRSGTSERWPMVREIEILRLFHEKRGGHFEQTSIDKLVTRMQMAFTGSTMIQDILEWDPPTAKPISADDPPPITDGKKVKPKPK